MEVIIIKQANPLVACSKQLMVEHTSQSRELLRTLCRGRRSYSVLRAEGTQHLRETHVVSHRICMTGIATAIRKFPPYLQNYSDTILKHVLNAQNSRLWLTLFKNCFHCSPIFSLRDIPSCAHSWEKKKTKNKQHPKKTNPPNLLF